MLPPSLYHRKSAACCGQISVRKNVGFMRRSVRRNENAKSNSVIYESYDRRSRRSEKSAPSRKKTGFVQSRYLNSTQTVVRCLLIRNTPPIRNSLSRVFRSRTAVCLQVRWLQDPWRVAGQDQELGLDPLRIRTGSV